MPDPEDGRQARLTITDKGHTLHSQVIERMVAREELGFRVLDAEDLEALDRILQKLAHHAAALPD